MRAGARDARRVRPLLPRERTGRGVGRRGRDQRDPRRRERRRASWPCARRSGLPIRVLSREQEARYGYLAAVNSTTLERRLRARPRRRLAAARARRRAMARSSGSWPLGTVRMSERFLPANGPAKRRQLEELREHVAAALADAAWLSDARPSGTAAPGRHRRHRAQPRRGRPARGGAAVQRGAGDVRSSARRSMSSSSGSPRCRRPSAASVPGIKPARADLILAGAVVVQGVLRAGGFDALETTEAGLREGVFFERLLGRAGRGRAAAVRRCAAARAC